MLTRQERNAFFLLALVTLAVVAGSIIIESIGKSTFSTRYTSASADGSLVLLEGTVDRLVVTKNGADMILTVNGTSVFIPASSARGVSLKTGDTIRIIGVVQTYRGEKEILVQQPGDIRLRMNGRRCHPGSTIHQLPANATLEKKDRKFIPEYDCHRREYYLPYWYLKLSKFQMLDIVPGFRI